MGEQKLANLPYERTREAPHFTYCGADMFGPFYIKEDRSELNRYGAMFVCLAIRAVHIELTHQINTDSFMHSLGRMIARGGNARLIQSDNGNNLLGAENELKRAFLEINNKKFNQFHQDNGTDWIKWCRTAPAGGLMGGVMEQQIRSARSIFLSLLKTHSQSLNDESFSTLMAEVERFMNSRPLTVETLIDVTSYESLSPSDLLTMRSKVELPSAGKFQKEDLYARKYWRRAQQLANEFWCRWRKEVL